MPVSHLGLTVSHIPSSTSFFQAALAPLGYRFIGHQGNSIGFGIDSADFFITQAPYGSRPSPNHIAFLAEDRNVVRNCYTAALNAGGRPSGAPDYRNDNCSCFNAAVEDLDGNTIEFIFRQPHDDQGCCGDPEAPEEGTRVMTWQKDVAASGGGDDVQSVAESVRSKRSAASNASRARSRMQTTLDLASNTSKSVKSVAPSQGIARTSTAPADTGFSNKTLIGTALGAAAGAALMYAMTREEGRNAREEADHLNYMSRSRSKPRYSMDEPRMMPPLPRAETMPPSIPALSQAPKSEGRRSHRNYSTTESAYSRPHPRSTQAMKMIEATGYNDDDEVQEAISRYDNLRPMPTRSRTMNAIEPAPEYAPKSSAGHTSHSIKRASTLPVDAEQGNREPLYLEAPKSTISRQSNHSRHSTHSYRRRSHDDTDKLKRHDSGISMHSSRSRRERASESGRRSSTSTIKPSGRRASEQDAIPLPPPPIGLNAPSKAPSRNPSSCYYPAAISLPPSAASSKHSSRKAEPRLDVKESMQSWENFRDEDAEESDGLGDIKTVLPEDSISCVDLSKPRRRHTHSSRHGGSTHSRSSRRSDATVKPANKEKSFLLPIRRKEGSSSRFNFV
ncbi:hypothetical protein AC579_1601 [Pseudocercospora musae]|uniref:VOC domain-containing protein n=1 Tax=Pseudocercospora musae TaxID=113226 RepID=A0A139HFY5_9PEZI|nr:hypothetical protein AC579_1601 [Pseudocercospora musae]